MYNLLFYSWLSVSKILLIHAMNCKWRAQSARWIFICWSANQHGSTLKICICINKSKSKVYSSQHCWSWTLTNQYFLFFLLATVCREILGDTQMSLFSCDEDYEPFEVVVIGKSVVHECIWIPCSLKTKWCFTTKLTTMLKFQIIIIIFLLSWLFFHWRYFWKEKRERFR